MDSTTEFLRSFYSQKFASFEEFQFKLKDFERITGSIYIIQSSTKLPDDNPDRDRLVYSALHYVCYHFGVSQSPIKSARNQRSSRSSCSSRITLSAMKGRLWITKYHMIHSHPPLPESAKIDQNIRKMQIQEPGKEDLIISDEVQVVLDDIVDQLPNHNVSFNESDDQSPTKNSKPVDMKPSCERKAAAKDRMAARIKKARGLKLAPCLRRLAELASSGTGTQFHAHIGELEALVNIWRRGDVSSLSTMSTGDQNQESTTPIQNFEKMQVVTTVETTPSIPSSTDSFVIAKAVEQLFRKQKLVEKPNSITTPKPRGRPPKTPKPLSLQSTPLTNQQSPTLSVALKQALSNTPTTILTAQPQQCIVSPSSIGLSRTMSTPVNGTINTNNLSVQPNSQILLTDPSSGQVQVINGANLIPQKSADGQTIVGYVLQPLNAASTSASVMPSGVLAQGFVPIAPKGPVPEILQTFSPLSPSGPKPVRAPLPVCKPKQMKKTMNAGLRQLKSKSPLKDNQNSLGGSQPSVTPFEGDETQRPWTSMIMEGDSCPYFLYIEDANFYYSNDEDAWLPVDQQTTPVEN